MSLRTTASRWRNRRAVPPRDPAALADAIERLANDPDLQVHMGAAGRRRAVAVFGFGPHVAAFEQVYRETPWSVPALSSPRQ